MEFLTFQVYGPMVSWGEAAVGERRNSASRPTRSAVLGLLAASLGMARDDARHDLLEQGFGFGLCVLSEGRLMEDFHTSQREKKPERWMLTRKDALSGETTTGLSTRAYRQDALALVALWVRQDVGIALAELQGALTTPVFVPYLGRKSCPVALPFHPSLQQAGTLRAALDQYPADASVAPKRAQRSYYWDEIDQPGMPAQVVSERMDAPGSRLRWQHRPRREFACLPGMVQEHEQEPDHVS